MCTARWAKILHSEEKLPFASHMVQVLNMILFTASELYTLRMQLKDLANPVMVGLCMLELVEGRGRGLALNI